MATSKKKTTDKGAKPAKKFHGFVSPKIALEYYYHHELHGRYTECFEFRQELALLNWLSTRDEAKKTAFPAVSGKGRSKPKSKTATPSRPRGK